MNLVLDGLIGYHHPPDKTRHPLLWDRYTQSRRFLVTTIEAICVRLCRTHPDRSLEARLLEKSFSPPPLPHRGPNRATGLELQPGVGGTLSRKLTRKDQVKGGKASMTKQGIAWAKELGYEDGRWIGYGQYFKEKYGDKVSPMLIAHY